MVMLQLAFTYSPTMNRLFSTAPLGLGQWLEIIAAGALVMVAVAAEKALRRRAAEGAG